MANKKLTEIFKTLPAREAQITRFLNDKDESGSALRF